MKKRADSRLEGLDEATRRRVRAWLEKYHLDEHDPAAVQAIFLAQTCAVTERLPEAIDRAADRLVARAERAVVAVAWSRWQLALILTTVLAAGLLGVGAGWLWREVTLAQREPLAHWLLTSKTGQQWLALARANDLEEALAYCRQTTRPQEGRAACLLPLWTGAVAD